MVLDCDVAASGSLLQAVAVRWTSVQVQHQNAAEHSQQQQRQPQHMLQVCCIRYMLKVSNAGTHWLCCGCCA